MPARPIRVAIAALAGTLTAGVLAATGAGPAAYGADDGIIDMLVLGDSYSAGNGATDADGNVVNYGPDGCHRSYENWGAMYAAGRNAAGAKVRLVNHACSGGVTADFTKPRALSTSSNQVIATPSGVTTTDQADAYLTAQDPCNTGDFPDEQFWTYAAGQVTPLVITYSCTRNVLPQVDFVTPDTDLVVFTMGGNDAGFSGIVTNCFLAGSRTASGCQAKVDAARALLPTIQQRLLTAVDAMRSHGLRDNAKIVQLGYPWLQVDNDFTLTDPSGTYAAGDAVRQLVTDGDAAIAAIVPQANAGHPGQMSFVDGVPQQFSGHEPDATTPIGNTDRWINQIGDTSDTAVWYHPNRLGQTAYAALLATHGTFGAPTGPAATTTTGGTTPGGTTPGGTTGGTTTGGASGSGAGNGSGVTSVSSMSGTLRVTSRLTARFSPKRVHRGDKVVIRVRVSRSNGTAPAGAIVVRGLGRTLAQKVVPPTRHGKLRLSFRLTSAKPGRIRVTYRDVATRPVHISHRLRTS